MALTRWNAKKLCRDVLFAVFRRARAKDLFIRGKSSNANVDIIFAFFALSNSFIFIFHSHPQKYCALKLLLFVVIYLSELYLMIYRTRTIAHVNGAVVNMKKKEPHAHLAYALIRNQMLISRSTTFIHIDCHVFSNLHCPNRWCSLPNWIDKCIELVIWFIQKLHFGVVRSTINRKFTWNVPKSGVDMRLTSMPSCTDTVAKAHTDDQPAIKHGFPPKVYSTRFPLFLARKLKRVKIDLQPLVANISHGCKCGKYSIHSLFFFFRSLSPELFINLT